MTSKKTAQILLSAFGSFFVAFLVYANWEEKPLSAQAPPMSLLVLSTAQPLDSIRFEAAQIWLAEQPGIRAVGGQAMHQQLAVSIDPLAVQGEEILAALASKGYSFKPVQFEAPDPNAPQCPVPMEYIQAFQKITYAFNFR